MKIRKIPRGVMMNLNETMFERISERAARSPKDAYRVLMERFDVAMTVNEEFRRSPALEKDLLGGFRLASEDQDAVESEQSLLDSWKYGSLYARKVIQGRWDEFEKAVEQSQTEECRSSLESLLSYCKLVGGVWSGAERHVATDADLAARYAIEVSRAPWDEQHPAVGLIRANREVFERYNSFVDDYEARNGFEAKS